MQQTFWVFYQQFTLFHLGMVLTVLCCGGIVNCNTNKCSCAAKKCFETVTFLTHINVVKIRFWKYLRVMNDVSINIYYVYQLQIPSNNVVSDVVHFHVSVSLEFSVRIFKISCWAQHMICMDNLICCSTGCIQVYITVGLLTVLKHFHFVSFQNCKFVVLSTENLMCMEACHSYNNTHNN